MHLEAADFVTMAIVGLVVAGLIVGVYWLIRALSGK